MPGSNARALEKAKSLPADCLILDLEDAVAPDSKDLARGQIADALKGGGYGLREVIVRINGFDTAWGADDLAALAPLNPDAILVPKVNAAADIEDASAKLDASGAGSSVALWVMMETPLAVLNARDIAQASNRTRLSGLVMGTNDLAKEMRGRITPDREPFIGMLGTCVLAARAYGLSVFDGVFNDIANAEGFHAECVAGKDLGFDGKTLIHPSQIAPCNDSLFAGRPGTRSGPQDRRSLRLAGKQRQGRDHGRRPHGRTAACGNRPQHGGHRRAYRADGKRGCPVSKAQTGNYFEDFSVGQVIEHATPRTITLGDCALYTSLYGTRFAVQSSAAFARALGYTQAPVDDLLVFHVVFGKTVPDISLNAIANLGYADCRFLRTVYPGDTSVRTV